MKNKEKIFHFHLEDNSKNAKTLVCLLENGGLKYSFFGGHGSSGSGFALSNIQYYDRIDGRISWKRNASLPVSTLEDETKEQFKERVKNMLKNSTINFLKEITTNVTFA
tara:strand:+ start:38 stop:364 length:327 start_codon:yes stop_codon:yes gene_type:complete